MLIFSVGSSSQVWNRDSGSTSIESYVVRSLTGSKTSASGNFQGARRFGGLVGFISAYPSASLTSWCRVMAKLCSVLSVAIVGEVYGMECC